MLVTKITKNRVTAGVHFHSDSKAGIMLAEELFDKLDISVLFRSSISFKYFDISTMSDN